MRLKAHPNGVGASAATPLTRFFERVFLPRRLGAATATTVRNYRMTIRFFRRFLGRAGQLRDLVEERILAFCRWRADAGRTASTILTDFSKLVYIARWAAQRRFLDNYLDIRFPLRPCRRAPTAWTPAQWRTLLVAAATTIGMIAGIPAGRWWLAFLHVAISTGFRCGALLRLQWCDVDLVRPAVLARGEDSKSGRDEWVGISTEAVEALRAVEAPTRRLVFPWTMNVTTYYRHWRRLLKRAGLPWTRRDKTQKIRRTSGTWAEIVAGPGAGQRLLGHSTPSVTRTYYLDRTLMPEENIAAQFHRLL